MPLTDKQLVRLRRLADDNLKAIPSVFVVALLDMYDQTVHERDTLQMHLAARNVIIERKRLNRK